MLLRSFRNLSLLALSLLIVSAGCDRDDSPAVARTAQAGEGVIAGRVIFTGIAPQNLLIPGSPGVKDESIVVGANQGLKNVIVFLKDAPRSNITLNQPAVLDQVNCVYVPHVLAIKTGQPLVLKSSDSCMHNVHLKCQVNPDANYGFTQPGEKQLTLDKAEAPFPVRCDVHPWMGAWIGVFDHPWFAVTAADGSFRIEHVPPGTYTIAAWQESLPQQEQTITVANTGQTRADFKFDSP